MFSRYQRKKLCDSIQILDVFRHYGIRTIPDGMGRHRCHCPFHHDRTPSLKIYPRDNSWYAYCCCNGITVWDFIYLREGSYNGAEKVLKELATIEVPEDPLDDLINELKEQEKKEQEQRVSAVAYLIGITLRDFLRKYKEDIKYGEYFREVDELYKELDGLLELEDIEEEEMKDFQKKVQVFISNRSQVTS